MLNQWINDNLVVSVDRTIYNYIEDVATITLFQNIKTSQS